MFLKQSHSKLVICLNDATRVNGELTDNNTKLKIEKDDLRLKLEKIKLEMGEQLKAKDDEVCKLRGDLEESKSGNRCQQIRRLSGRPT